MNSAFAAHIAALESKLHSLITMEPVRFHALPSSIPERGVYLLSEGRANLYVGRTNGIRKRLQGHCRMGGSHNSASFAFRIARQETGFLKATYRTQGSRASLLGDSQFGQAFALAKARVNAMDIRYVEVRDAVGQALLEIYAAMVLQTPYNDFENH